MATPKQLLSAVESALLNSTPPSASQRMELMLALRHSLPSLQSLLSFPPPKASDRAQVQLKEVRLPNSSPISLDDNDVQIALKLSDDLHLNEIDCVRLLVSANQEWGLLGRDPSEILRLTAGLWYTERRDLITALYTLLRAVVLDQGLEGGLVADIQKYMEDLITAGLQQKLISLIKELNREEPSGLGGPNSERFVLDSKGALVERRAVVSRERLILVHSLVLSILVVRASPKDVKDLFSVLKDNAAELSTSNETIKHQIIYGLLFSLVIAFISDALSAAPDRVSVLSRDALFRREFHESVMAHVSDSVVEGLVDCVRLAWAVHLLLIQDTTDMRETAPSASSSGFQNALSCLDIIFSSNVFQFFQDRILQTAAYQNDDEDMIFMYNAYLHKLITCFISHPFARDKIKETKEKAMTALSPYRVSGSHDYIHDSSMDSRQAAEASPQPFVSLLEFVSVIYQKEPELLVGNDVLWTFVNFAGEDHTNFQTLVAFLKMLSTLACSEEGASKVYDLLKGNTFRSIGWSTLFDCLSTYEEKFKQSLQDAGAILPEFQEGDAKALVAYLIVLQKVLENGNSTERKNWFPDIEPLFKLLGYENVPPYLKGALRDTITTFLRVSPNLKDTTWGYLEQYDLPVVVGPPTTSNTQPVSQVYDMRYELNEIEARREQYPSTISFINLLNALIAEERDVIDKGQRFIGIFRFVYDDVFGPFPQRAYSDSCEKWQLVVACLQHFHMILSMYDIEDEDAEIAVDQSPHSAVGQSAPLQRQLPVIELLKDFMSGKSVFRNIMSILLPGVNFIINERTTQIYGQLLEKAVLLSLEVLILVLEKDLIVSDLWRPLYQILFSVPLRRVGLSYITSLILSQRAMVKDGFVQSDVLYSLLLRLGSACNVVYVESFHLDVFVKPLDIILFQDHSQIVVLLEYVRYDSLPHIQQCSIKILSVLSARMVGLVPLLLKSNAASSIIEDYAACLELRSEESQIIENSTADPGVLILQLLIDNISRPAPNIAHLLLKFDLDTPIERTVLQPKFHYSCLKVILDILEKLPKPDINSLLLEFGFQLVYELCSDPLTSGPIMDLLSNKRYQFFVKHLETLGVAPLPKRSNSQALRISSLHQRAWLLKLWAIELHFGDFAMSSHKEVSLYILAQMFGNCIVEIGVDFGVSPSLSLQNSDGIGDTRTNTKSKALKLLEVVQFRSPNTSMKYSEAVSNMKFAFLAEDILENPATTSKGGIYYYSERGDRLIDLAALRDKLWQKCNIVYPHISSFGSEVELTEVKDTIQQLLRWGWKYNKNLEEQAAQLHMLTGWSQIVEVSASRRMSSLENRSDILSELLDASLGASASPDCSLKMAINLTQVALTCMAKLRDERFLCPGGLNSDTVTCLNIIMSKQLSNGACNSILFKLIMSLLRHDTSEALRRRQYSFLLSYFQYCRHMLHPDVPTSILQSLLLDEQNADDLDLQKIEKEQAELARVNFSILKKDAHVILDLVMKDTIQGSESGKAIALYILDALISVDHEKYFLSQIQSRGFLRSCFTSISNFSYQDGGCSFNSLQRVCVLEAELSLLLRVSHIYGKSGAQVLFSMGALEHISSCRAINIQIQGGSLRQADAKFGDVSVDKRRMIISPILRLVFSLTSLIDASDFFEVKNKIVREVIDFVKGHQFLFDQVLRENISAVDELTLEQMNLVVGILGKVWPYEESGDYGFVQGLLGMMCTLFSLNFESFISSQSACSLENQWKLELNAFRLCFSLSSYLYFLVTKKSLRLLVSDSPPDYHAPARPQQPTLTLLTSFLDSVTTSLERAVEEKYLLLNKIQDINELSRQEVDDIINMCAQQNSVSSSDNIQKRRYIAMMEMGRIAGTRDQLITLVILLAENVLNIILVHFQESLELGDSVSTMKTITYGSKHDSPKDVHTLWGELLSTLEKLELMSEEKTGHNLKIFHRLVNSLKQTTLHKLAL